MTSDYQTGADYAKEIGLEIHQWQWIRDRFKDPVAYKRYNNGKTESLAKKIFIENICEKCGRRQ